MKVRIAQLVAAGASALLLAAPAGSAAAAAPTPPTSDPFYSDTQPLAKITPGTVLRVRPVTIAGSLASSVGAAYQLLFRTTDNTGAATVADTTVLVPKSSPSGPRRLASYQTAYDSLTLNCAPSYTLRGGAGGGGATNTIEMGLIGQELKQGWDVNVPDYEGMKSEWIVGPTIGRATLDSIRAAERYAADGLSSSTEVAINGYSGGSEATTWAAALAPSYAPDIDLVGAAAGGNFPNLDYTLGTFDGSIFFGTEIGALESFSRAYPQLNLSQILNPAGQALAAADGQDASGCGGAITNEPLGRTSQYSSFATGSALAADPVVKSVLEAGSLINGPMPTTPEFIYNGAGDELAHVAPVDAWVDQSCAAGVTVDYDRDPLGLEHIEAIVDYWPAALKWMEARFAGQPAPDTCLAGSKLTSPQPGTKPAPHKHKRAKHKRRRHTKKPRHRK